MSAADLLPGQAVVCLHVTGDWRAVVPIRAEEVRVGPRRVTLRVFTRHGER